MENKIRIQTAGEERKGGRKKEVKEVNIIMNLLLPRMLEPVRCVLVFRPC